MRGVLFDLDGTIYEDGVPLPGAAEAVAELRRRGVAVGFVTNATSRSRRLIRERLANAGVPAEESQIVTALRAGADHLRARGARRVAPLLPEAALEDLAEFELTQERPDAVVVGDLDDRWDFALLNRAFNQLMEGAELVALSRDRYWRAAEGLVLDSGPFVAALEYASHKTAALTGKPSAEFFRSALAMLGDWALSDPSQVLMVGDDVWGDVRGAQEAGLRGALVRTGKFRADALAKSGVVPDLVLESVAEVLTTADSH